VRAGYDGYVRLGLVIACFVTVFLVACGGNDGGPGLPTSAPAGPTLPPIATRPAVTATPVAGHPVGTRVNVPAIDAAIAAFESGDEARVLAALSFHPLPCDARGTSRAAPCPAGVQNGSNVDSVALAQCDTVFLAKGTADLGSAVRQYVRGSGDAKAVQPRVYAVTEVSQSRVTSALPFRYLVIFVSGHSVLIDDAGITHLASPCGDVGPVQLFHPADMVVLGPVG
jgi:hypothetical protein